MALVVPKGQTISFDPLDCCPADRWCQKVSSSADCEFIENPCLTSILAAPNPPTGWTVATGTVIDTNPVRITSTPALNFELRQTVNIPIGTYELHYDYVRNFVPHTAPDQFILQGTAVVEALPESLSQVNVKGVITFTLAVPATLSMIMRFTGGIDTDVTVNKLYICEPGGQLDDPFCFQVKGTSSGMDTHLIDEICFDDTVTDDLPGLTGVSFDVIPPQPADNVEAVLTTTATTAAGLYCIDYNLGWAQDLGLCPSDGSEGSDLVLDGSTAGVFDTNCLPDTGTVTLPIPTQERTLTQTLALGETIDVRIETEYEFTNPNYEINYVYSDFTINVTKLFKEELFTLKTGFYNICLDLNDYTFVRIIITQQIPLQVVFDKSYTGLSIDDIIFIAAPGDYEVRFEVTECVDTCLQNFKLDLLSAPTSQLQDCDGNFVASVTPERIETPADVGFTYSENSNFCYDFLGITQGAYQIQLFDTQTPDTFLSNCLSVCDDLSKQTRLTWSYDGEVCQGDCVIDYANFPTTQTLYLRTDLKPSPTELERLVVTKSTGFRSTPYATKRATSALEIYDVPDYIRWALTLALCLQINVDGTTYELAEDAVGITELEGKKFVDIRVLVSQVGCHWIVKNC